MTTAGVKLTSAEVEGITAEDREMTTAKESDVTAAEESEVTTAKDSEVTDAEEKELTTADESQVVHTTAAVPDITVTAPDFLGPFFIPLDDYTDFYFTCELTDSHEYLSVEYEVVMMFDGQVDDSLPVKTTTLSTPEVKFTSADLGQHFGQSVRYIKHQICSCICCFCYCCSSRFSYVIIVVVVVIAIVVVVEVVIITFSVSLKIGYRKQVFND